MWVVRDRDDGGDVDDEQNDNNHDATQQQGSVSTMQHRTSVMHA
jgi:hypothetical protein